MKVKEGTVLSYTQYFRVNTVNTAGDEISVTSIPGGLNMTVTGKPIIDSMSNNDSYEETVKCTKNELIDKLQTAKDKVFLISFNKENGDERIMTGRFNFAEVNMGRTSVIDLEVLEKNPEDKSRGIRLVDNRQINFLILGGVKYIAK